MTNSLPSWIKLSLRALYYLLILLGLFAIYSSTSFQTPAFVYQGF
jgi:hypothetical protein